MSKSDDFDRVVSEIDQLTAEVKDVFGEGRTFAAAKVLYRTACDEAKEIEADEPTEREEYEQAHAPGRVADARALKRQI